MENKQNNLLSVVDKIYGEHTDNYLDVSSLTNYENNIKVILEKEDTDIDLFDLLFMKRANHTSLLYEIVANNQNQLFAEILHKYKSKIESSPKEKWEPMLWIDENDCHTSLYSNFGKDFFDNIDHVNSSVLYYSNKNFIKHYSLERLDNFFKLENLAKIDNYVEDVFSHILIFYSKDKEGFEKILFNPPNNLQFEVHNFIYEDVKGAAIFSNSRILHVLNENEIKTLTSIWGVEKTSEVVSSYMNLQKKYMEAMDLNDNSSEFDSEKLKHLIKTQIHLTNCGSALAFGTRKNADLLSHFIIKGQITHEDLLENIRDKEIQTKTHHDILLNSLEEKNEEKLTKRNKL